MPPPLPEFPSVGLHLAQLGTLVSRQNLKHRGVGIRPLNCSIGLEGCDLRGQSSDGALVDDVGRDGIVECPFGRPELLSKRRVAVLLSDRPNLVALSVAQIEPPKPRHSTGSAPHGTAKTPRSGLS